jgi:hypothetical protein
MRRGDGSAFAAGSSSSQSIILGHVICCVESSSFKIMLNYARLVGREYTSPGRRDLGHLLLDINHRNIVEHNKEVLRQEADVFGLSWLSDGAAISRSPLINVLGLCADIPPIFVAIKDCSGHMSVGGKNDVKYIANLLEDVIVPYDPDKTKSAIFWFDGAGNVEKSGRIIQAKFPRSYSLHGGERVVSLFYSHIPKIKEINVTCSFCTHFCLILTFFFI